MMVSLREAVPSDRDALADLSTQLGYPTDGRMIEERLRRLVELATGRVLVAERSGVVVGWIHVEASHGLESEPWAEIRGLVVDERHRGRGVGAALLEAAGEWARKGGFTLLRLRTNVIRTETHEFYRRRGFRQLKTQHVFAKEL